MKIRLVLLVVGSVLLSSAFPSVGLAETKIEEIQPWPIDAPTQLIIWGTQFGQSPEFHFGTSATPLIVAADQSLCPVPLTGPAPPLDPSDVDCVVVNLPVVDHGEPNVPAGDYLLAIWVEGADECASKPTALTFEYTPSDCSGFNLQGASCSGDMTGSVGPAALVAQGNNKASWNVVSSPVANGNLVEFSGTSGRWPNELTLSMTSGVFSQDIQLHTSCSQPLAVGDEFGSMKLVAIEGDLKAGMQHDLYDLTLGSIGPQGSQGKQGDTGEQGPQGKIGDTGNQGPQGKMGDIGNQGPQGKSGDTGDQGVQGKLGDTGDQGVQGKLGDTGGQGVQGKLGDTGAQGVPGNTGATGTQGVQGKLGDTGETGLQGPQGKQGDAGAPGAGGIGSNLMCFGTDQTIGTSGKHMGLGQQAGDHDSVGVISPFGADAQVLVLVVKAAQGNQARSGEAQLFHDAPGNAQGGVSLGGICTLNPTATKSVCKVTIAGGDLVEFDSLSVFIKADGGSFEGGSACVLIDPDGVSP
jgi:hypothetical protein